MTHQYLVKYSRPDGTMNVLPHASKLGLAAQKRWFRQLFPGYTLIEICPDWVASVIREVAVAGGPALTRLLETCHWKNLSLSAAVIRYGDPRHGNMSMAKRSHG